MAGKKNKATKKSAKPAKPVEPEESSEGSSESEEMEVEAPVTPKVKKQAKQAKAAKKEESSDSEEEESSEEEEEVVEVKKPAAKKAAAAAAAEPDDSEEEEEEESSEEDSSEESEEAPKPKAKAKADGKEAKKKAAEAESDDSEEEEEEEEEDSSEEDSSEESDEEPKVNGKGDASKDAKKRKAEVDSGNDSKKAKVDEPVTVLCRNIPLDVTNDKFEKFLKKKGIEYAAVRKRDDKMFAHIDLANPDDLDSVLAMSIDFKGSTLTFEKGRPFGANKPEKTERSNDDSKSLFVKNLSFDDSEDTVRSKLMEIFPEAQNVRIPSKGDSHKGFAYVEFESADSVKDAVDNKQGVECGDRKLFLDYAGGGGGGAKSDFSQKRGFRNDNRDDPEESNVLLVRNLSYDSTEDSLRSYFKDATDIRLPIFADSGKPKGIAFVDFESVSNAKTALSKFDGTNVDGRTVYCCFARSRGDGDGRSGGGFGGGRRGGGYGGGRGGGGGYGGRGGGGGYGGRGGGRGRGGFGGGRGGGRGRGGGGGGYGGGGRSSFGGTGKKKTFSDSD